MIKEYLRISKTEIIAIIVFVGIILIGKFIASNSTPSVLRLVKRDPSFTYVTSLSQTGNGHEKASVFKTVKTVRQTATYLIHLKEPLDSSDLNSLENISIIYKDEYVYVYKGENEMTYVQVSSRKYTYGGSAALYRPRRSSYGSFYRNYYIYKGLKGDSRRYRGRSIFSSTQNTFSTKMKQDFDQGSYSSTYGSSSSHSSSVRSGSAWSRSSRGGGMSFGK